MSNMVMYSCPRCQHPSCICGQISMQQFASQLEIQQRARQSQMMSIAPSNLFHCAYCLKMVREDETCECRKKVNNKRKLLLTIKRKDK